MHKIFLLATAASIVTVAGAQAADLPTKKGAAAADYVKVCKVDGMAGFVLPGSDTCLKIGGYVWASVEAGNTKTGYYWAGLGPTGQGKALLTTPANGNSNLGYSARGDLTLDARTNTPYGVLRSFVEIHADYGSGYDPEGNTAYLETAYMQWAGITAGKAPSFFSFLGGGPAWADFFSPDQQTYNEPGQFAYTAKFGDGFSATVAAQNSGPGDNGPGTNMNVNNYTAFGAPVAYQNTTNYGLEAPDLVASLRVEQNWGSAQVSGLAHQVRVYSDANTGSSLNTWGYAFDAGASFKLPQLGAGDLFAITGVYTRNATYLSGVNDGMWGEQGAVNGNGLAMSIGDTYSYAPGQWATPTAWSMASYFEHHFSPTVFVDPEISYLQVHWSNSGGQLPSNADSLIVGGIAHWDPVPHLDFAFETLYETTHQSTPGLYAAGGTIDGHTSPFPSTANGFQSRFQILRDF
jgi:hypothetical protein